MPKQLNRSFDMDIRPIRTKADYKAALREASAYFDNEPEPRTP